MTPNHVPTVAAFIEGRHGEDNHCWHLYRVAAWRNDGVPFVVVPGAERLVSVDDVFTGVYHGLIPVSSWDYNEHEVRIPKR